MGDAAALPGRLLAGVSSPCAVILLAAKGSIRGTKGLEGLRDSACTGMDSMLATDVCSGFSIVGVADTSICQRK